MRFLTKASGASVGNPHLNWPKALIPHPPSILTHTISYSYTAIVTCNALVRKAADPMIGSASALQPRVHTAQHGLLGMAGANRCEDSLAGEAAHADSLGKAGVFQRGGPPGLLEQSRCWRRALRRPPQRTRLPTPPPRSGQRAVTRPEQPLQSRGGSPCSRPAARPGRTPWRRSSITPGWDGS